MNGKETRGRQAPALNYANFNHKASWQDLDCNTCYQNKSPLVT